MNDNYDDNLEDVLDSEGDLPIYNNNNDNGDDDLGALDDFEINDEDLDSLEEEGEVEDSLEEEEQQ
jgi:hypothetical protein